MKLPLKIGLAIAVALILVAIVGGLVRNPNSETKKPPPAASNETPLYPPPMGGPEGEARIVEVDKRPVVRKSEIKVASPFAVLETPREWFLRAQKGDATAAASVFRLIRNCVKFGPSIGSTDPLALPETSSGVNSSNQCEQIPANFASDPFIWLEPAAEKGSLEAKILYGSNAALARAWLRNSVDADRVAQIHRKAIDYLEDAASYGVVDAYTGLARAYATGAAVSRDEMQAYAYMEMAARLSGDSNLKAQATALQARVRQGLLPIAEDRVKQLESSCCKPPPQDMPTQK